MTIFSSGPSPNPQVFNPTTQISLLNQTELGDVDEPQENLLGDNFLMFLPHGTQN